MNFSNRIKVSAIGTIDTMTLGIPIDGFVVFPDGQTNYTVIAEDGTWQLGTATVAGATMTIDTVEQNSAGTTVKLDFSGKTIQIAQTITGLDMNMIQAGIALNSTDITDLQNEKLDTNAQASDSALLQGQDGPFYLNRANQTGMQSPDTVSFNNVNATDLIDLQHFIDHVWSAGLTDGGIVSDGGGSTVNVAEAEVAFRVANTDHSIIVSMKVAAQTGIPIVFDQFIIIYADYNNGSPIFLTTNDLGSLDFRTEVPICGCVSNSVTVDTLQVYNYNSDGLNKIQHRFLDFGLAHAPGGTVLGESGVQNISITPGKFYLGVKPIPDSAYDTAGTDTFTYWYQDGVGGWTAVTDQTQIDVDNRDDGSGTLDSLGNGRYSQSWVYLNVHDGRSALHVLYGIQNANNVNPVISSSAPSVLPPTLNVTGILIGRVIIREGVSTFYQVDSAFARDFELGGVTVHNTLSGLQGGLSNEFYHLTAQEYADLQAYPVNNRVEWKKTWEPGIYLYNQMVRDGNWTMICTATATEERAAPSPTGEPYALYSGTLTQNSISAKQLILGLTIVTQTSGFLEGYRVYVYPGQIYNGYLVEDSGGENVITDIGGFVSTAEGWRVLNMPAGLFLSGASISVFMTVHKQDDTPVDTVLSYDYDTTNDNSRTPDAGDIVHASRSSSPLRVNYVDNNSNDNTIYLQSLTVGDIIEGAGQRWTIQGITLQTGFIDFDVSPASQGSPQGIQDFTFEVVSSQLLYYGYEANYWASTPSILGLYGADVGFENIIGTDDEYGIDLIIQDAIIPNDWDMISTGADFLSTDMALNDLSNNPVLVTGTVLDFSAGDHHYTNTVSTDTIFTFDGLTNNSKSIIFELTLATGIENISFTGADFQPLPTFQAGLNVIRFTHRGATTAINGFALRDATS